VGHDEDLGGTSNGLGVSGERDRLLLTRNRGLESFTSLPHGRSGGSGGASGPGTVAGGEARNRSHSDHRQWHTNYLFAFSGDTRTAWHHASQDGVSSPGRQQLHRTLPSQLEGRGSLDHGVSQRGGSTRQHRSLDRRVQSRPAALRSRKSHPERGVL